MSEAKPAEGMRIVALEASNVKRLSAVAIKPDGSVVEITGRNGQGKTSVLDAIWWAMQGTKHIQAVPIRKGADKATIKLDLGKLKITRRFTQQDDGDYTTSLTVENEEGAKYSSPQAMLDALVGELAFDPLAFSRMKPADQFDACRRFVPDVDFDAIAAAQRDDYATRTAVNRQAKDLRAQADGITFETITDTLRDESELVAQLEQAGQHNADVERRRGNREKAEADIERLKQGALNDEARADDAQRAVEAAKNAARQKLVEAAELQCKLNDAGPLPAAIDTAALAAAIEDARQHNQRINTALEAAKRKNALEKQAADAEQRAAALTQAMEKRDKDKLAAIAKAKLPVAGLTFGDGCVLLDGLPFEQASDAQRLSASLAIASALNPKLRVLRVREGSVLDNDAMKQLGEFAEANDMQVWVETVQSGRPGAVVIEDGRVAGADTPKTEAA